MNLVLLNNLLVKKSAWLYHAFNLTYYDEVLGLNTYVHIHLVYSLDLDSLDLDSPDLDSLDLDNQQQQFL